MKSWLYSRRKGRRSIDSRFIIPTISFVGTILDYSVPIKMGSPDAYKWWTMPPDSVDAATRPNRLRALRMLEPFDDVAGAGEHQLRDWFRCTEHLIRLVEVPHRSHASLLNGLLTPLPDWLLNRLACSPDAVPTVELNRLPSLVVDAYQRDRSGLPLTVDHIAALVLWFGDWSVPVARFDVLAGHVTLTTVRDALQMAVFRCCQLQTPLTDFTLLKALFAACD